MTSTTTPVLTIELVPSTCWFSNARSILSPSDWEKCKRFVRQRSGDRCEICGGRGPRWPVECHEVWRYDLPSETQFLDGLIALCPDCHQVKHIGFAQIKGREVEALRHLAEVNAWSYVQAAQYVADSFELWRARSTVYWALDISWLGTIGIDWERYATKARDRP